jgi:hypothetical protein
MTSSDHFRDFVLDQLSAIRDARLIAPRQSRYCASVTGKSRGQIDVPMPRGTANGMPDTN